MAVHNAENTRGLADVYDSIKNAVATIELPDGSGSGFAVRSDGILATNRHVIAGHTKARVSFVDGNDTDAQVVQSFRDVDLAFLLTEEPLRQVLPLHNGEQLRGGGPLCDLDGQVIGMATWGQRYDSQGTPLEGLNFVLPASVIQERLALLPKRSELLETLHCPVCGSVNEKGQYCGNCGADIASYIEETAGSFEKYTTLETCSVCQTKAQHGQGHCGHCGASLELVLLDTCPVCQTRAQQGQQHCGHCGASLVPETDED